MKYCVPEPPFGAPGLMLIRSTHFSSLVVPTFNLKRSGHSHTPPWALGFEIHFDTPSQSVWTYKIEHDHQQLKLNSKTSCSIQKTLGL
jgi:hypothetical protein